MFVACCTHQHSWCTDMAYTSVPCWYLVGTMLIYTGSTGPLLHWCCVEGSFECIEIRRPIWYSALLVDRVMNVMKTHTLRVMHLDLFLFCLCQFLEHLYHATFSREPYNKHIDRIQVRNWQWPCACMMNFITKIVDIYLYCLLSWDDCVVNPEKILMSCYLYFDDTTLIWIYVHWMILCSRSWFTWLAI